MFWRILEDMLFFGFGFLECVVGNPTEHAFV